jgi:hypothetical protein
LVFECKDLSAAEIHLLVRVDGNKVRNHQRVGNGVQISKQEESVQKTVRKAAVPQLPAQLLQLQLEGRLGDHIVTGPL